VFRIVRSFAAPRMTAPAGSARISDLLPDCGYYSRMACDHSNPPEIEHRDGNWVVTNIDRRPEVLTDLGLSIAS